MFPHSLIVMERDAIGIGIGIGIAIGIGSNIESYTLIHGRNACFKFMHGFLYTMDMTSTSVHVHVINIIASGLCEEPEIIGVGIGFVLIVVVVLIYIVRDPRSFVA